MDLERALDILSIQEVLTNYCHAIDFREFDKLDDVFTPDAHIDYTQVGGAKGDRETIKAWLAEALAKFGAFSHIASNPQISFDGDTASSRTILFNPMPVPQDGAAPHVFFCGGWYVDDWVRTDAGWRIRKRVEQAGYFHNLPASMTGDT